MTSSLPNARYAKGLRRVGFDGAAIEFFDEHVEADAVHENIACVDLAGGPGGRRARAGRRHPVGARAAWPSWIAASPTTCWTPGRPVRAPYARR